MQRRDSDKQESPQMLRKWSETLRLDRQQMKKRRNALGERREVKSRSRHFELGHCDNSRTEEENQLKALTI